MDNNIFNNERLDCTTGHAGEFVSPCTEFSCPRCGGEMCQMIAFLDCATESRNGFAEVAPAPRACWATCGTTTSTMRATGSGRNGSTGRSCVLDRRAGARRPGPARGLHRADALSCHPARRYHGRESGIERYSLEAPEGTLHAKFYRSNSGKESVTTSTGQEFASFEDARHWLAEQQPVVQPVADPAWMSSAQVLAVLASAGHLWVTMAGVLAYGEPPANWQVNATFADWGSAIASFFERNPQVKFFPATAATVWDEETIRAALATIAEEEVRA